jgi:hypothetical protein
MDELRAVTGLELIFSLWLAFMAGLAVGLMFGRWRK